MSILNKRAAGEGLSWAAGLIIIALIIIFAVFFSIAGKFGQKSVVIGYDSNIYSSESQRVAAYAVISDFNSSSKGKILSEIYSNTEIRTRYLSAEDASYGESLYYLNNFPILPLSNYNVVVTSYSSLAMSDSFYIPCSRCGNNYLLFSLGVKNGK